jgi:Platelet-activating factor acetylhydrolase, isoform II
MLRRLYCWLLRMHPPYFRQRFTEEMLSIFDQTAGLGRRSSAKLLADGAMSLARQWTLRQEFWEEPAGPAVDGIPRFYSFESYKPRKGALIYGALLSVATFTVFCITFNYGIHEVLPPQPAGAQPGNSSNISGFQCTRRPLDGAANMTSAEHSLSSKSDTPYTTLGPETQGAHGIWPKAHLMFSRSASSVSPMTQRDGGSARHSRLNSEAPPQGMPSRNSAGGLPMPVQPSSNIRIQLPHPSGRYGVARVAYDWMQRNDARPLAKASDTGHELMAYVWYPTSHRASRTVADYLPHADRIAKNLSTTELQDEWGSSWHRVFTGRVLTDTYERSPAAVGGERFPLLIFSPGLNLSSTSYTSLIQEVVSHGYIVASIEPVYESTVALPDGRIIRPTSDVLGSRRPLPGESWDEYLNRMHTSGMPQVERHAADIRFVIDQLTALNRMQAETAPFAGRIDLQSIGVWGHSIGGRAATRACQLDSRIKACLNADGVGPDGPVFPYESAGLPRQPFMWIEASQLPPSIDSILTSYKITPQDSGKGHLAGLAAKQQEQELEACPSGSYHLVVNDAGTTHYSFTDWPLLEAERQEDFNRASHALEPIETYSVAFFDRYLKHQDTALVDNGNTASAEVTLKKYGKAR